jgi:acetyl-CoA C-acetyltransferase
LAVDDEPDILAVLEERIMLNCPDVKDGAVIAGKSSSLNDGAAAIIMISLDRAKDLGIKPLARVVATGFAAVDAKIMGIGVVPSVRRALYFANLPIEAIDYWEINEVFAAQIIRCNRELKISLDKIIYKMRSKCSL